MLLRAAALFFLLFAVSSIRAQEVFNNSLTQETKSAASALKKVESAWLDLRQIPSANSKPQETPEWVEAVSIVPGNKTPGVPETTIFRIRLIHPGSDAQVLFVRVFFDDKPEQKPRLTAWDESG